MASSSCYPRFSLWTDRWTDERIFRSTDLTGILEKAFGPSTPDVSLSTFIFVSLFSLCQEKIRASQEMRMKLLISKHGGLLAPVSNSDIAMSFVTVKDFPWNPFLSCALLRHQQGIFYTTEKNLQQLLLLLLFGEKMRVSQEMRMKLLISEAWRFAGTRIKFWHRHVVRHRKRASPSNVSPVALRHQQGFSTRRKRICSSYCCCCLE
ncbi:hypothetical protein CEXT_210661 [Caerostris extrusa]|uniref:Uncharacterized protein n=1 Tax=Caerostris extrusa TaxID=172846 RepID=A0AAV4XJU9_CAEEX|nr:hypothetical protein CEXT_210661 [Caerostris extrusa]